MTPARTSLSFLAGLVLTTTLALTAPAQTSESAKPAEPSRHAQTSIRFFHLSNTTTQQEANEILTALRNMNDPHIKIIMTPAQNTIVMEGTDDQLAITQKLINELDKPRKAYRLTYTLIDLDGTRRLGDQHYTLVLVPGQRTVLKQGNKVPVVTGADLKNPNTPQTQITYLDVGMNFDAYLDDAPNSLRLKTKVEQSSVVEDRSATVAQDPIVRQSVFEGSAILTPGKSLIIGSLDIAGTTRRIEIQITAEPIP